MRSLSESITKRLDSYNESILSSNNTSPIIIIKNLIKHDSTDDCEELNDCWKMLHLDIKDCKWINNTRFDFYSYDDHSDESWIDEPLIWVFYNTRNKIPSIVFSKACDEQYKEKVVKTLKLEKSKKCNSYIYY